MRTLQHAVVFFDLDTLASVRSSAAGEGVDGLSFYPAVARVLEELHVRGARLGILSSHGKVPGGDDPRSEGGVHSLFDPELIFDEASGFNHRVEQASGRVLDPRLADGAPPRTLLFVGGEAAERAQAHAAGFLTVPHPALAAAVLRRREPLRYLRIRIPPAAAGADWRAVLGEQPLVPLHVSVEPDTEPPVLAVYAIADALTAAELDDLGFRVDRLGAPDEPLSTDLYLLRDDRRAESGFLNPVGSSSTFFGRGPAACTLLSSTHEGLLVAVPADDSVDRYHFPDARHGHTLRLYPSPALLAPPGGPPPPADPDLAKETRPLSDEEKRVLARYVNPEALASDVARYAGRAPVAGSRRIRSRHVDHPDNAEAVCALFGDLEKRGGSGLRVRPHPFKYRGRTAYNLEAVLPGPTGADEIVLVCAHLDSTAAQQHRYMSRYDPAPGADDDASGVAGVLAAAEALARLPRADQLREIRFVLFNAEEPGFVGSGKYASEQAALHKKIVAVFQMDMIGHDGDGAPHFELHAGYAPNLGLQARSRALARRIEDLIPEVSPGLRPQVYPDAGEPTDPGEQRSDHVSFLRVGFPACLVCEDFFAGHGSATDDRCPGYHRFSDSKVNDRYAADIARVVAAAAWVTATR